MSDTFATLICVGLQQQFKQAVTSGGDSGIDLKDVNQALNEMGKLGGDASTIGGVVEDIKAMQHASAWLSPARRAVPPRRFRVS